MKPNPPPRSYLWYHPKDHWQVTSFDPRTDEALGIKPDVKIYVLLSDYDALLKITQEQEAEIEALEATEEGWRLKAREAMVERDKLREENQRLNHDLQFVNDNCISLGLHNSRVDALERQTAQLSKLVTTLKEDNKELYERNYILEHKGEMP